VFSSFVCVELVTSFNYSYLNFIVGVCNEFNDWIDIVLLVFFFFFYCVEILRIYYHLNYHLFFHVMSIIIVNLNSI
jgi:hypothetical protein